MRIKFRSTLLCAALLALATSSAHAQQYPNRPVRILVGYAPGGSTDTAARIIGAKLQAALGQAFVVENIPGANAILAHQRAAKAAPDGYTLIISSSADTVNATLNASKTGYNYLTAFQPIARLTQSSFFVVVSASSPIRSVADLFDYARKNDNVSYGSSGLGTPSHLGVELMFQSQGLKALHVPYAGAGPATMAVLGNTVTLAFANTASGIALVEGGKVRAIAQSGKVRSPLAPNVPTVAESGVPNFDVVSWAGIDGPAGMPANIVKLLADTSLAALKSPDTIATLAKAGTEPYPQDTAEYTNFLKNEIAQWAKVLRTANVKPD
jgi:tripartite-type tricarboxylate transporter receptor subunit TctC